MLIAKKNLRLWAKAKQGPGEKAKAAVHAAWPARFDEDRYEIANADRFLPAADTDFAAFLVDKIDTPPGPAFVGRQPCLSRHLDKISPEMSGSCRATELLIACIVVLRRDPSNIRAPHLMFRLLDAHSADILPDLTFRWLRSIGDTLSDHGRTWPERMLGLTITLQLMQVKLAETERLVYHPARPWPPKKRWVMGGEVLDGEPSYWVEKGDMVQNTLKRMRSVLSEVEDSPGAALLAETMMRLSHSQSASMGRLGSLHDHPPVPVIGKPGKHMIRKLLNERL